MKTRSRMRTECYRQKEVAKEAEKEAEEIKRRILESEIWIMEGSVVNPLIPSPSQQNVEKWKTFISSVYSHPNVLVHVDVQCIRDLFQFLGADNIPYETANLMIELGGPTSEGLTNHCLQPLKSFVEVPMKLVFAHIKEVQLIPHLNVVIVREYSVMDDFKKALVELVHFVSTYPEVILYPEYTFLYDFLIKYGVSSESITYEIYQTQLRRASSKVPASTLLLKQGEPEVKTENTEQNCKLELLHLKLEASEVGSLQDSHLGKRSYRQSSCYSGGGDSGLGSVDQNDSSMTPSEVDTDDIKDEGPEGDDDDESSDNYDEGIPQGRGKKRIRKEGCKIKRPFRCTVKACPNRYAFKANCNRHIERHHPGAELHHVLKKIHSRSAEFVPSFMCSACQKGFSSKSSCKTHIQKFHMGDSTMIPCNNNKPKPRKEPSQSVNANNITESQLKDFNSTQSTIDSSWLDEKDDLLAPQENSLSDIWAQNTTWDNLDYSHSPPNISSLFSSHEDYDCILLKDF